jgi:hypothetical protein
MNNFENMGLSPEIVDALDDLGFQRPLHLMISDFKGLTQFRKK